MEKRQIEPGDLVVEKAFDISGDGIPETKGFTVNIAYEDLADMAKAAAAYTVIMVQNKIRTHYRKTQKNGMAEWLIEPGRKVTVDGAGNHTLTAEEKRAKAIAGVLAQAATMTADEKAKLAQALGLV